jgi:hypothetical protein
MTNIADNTVDSTDTGDTPTFAVAAPVPAARHLAVATPPDADEPTDPGDSDVTLDPSRQPTHRAS